jgi:hypothetical protein
MVVARVWMHRWGRYGCYERRGGLEELLESQMMNRACILAGALFK